MKQLSVAAGIDPSKVFPRNMRHLFARSFYNIKKDIARLADVLGHSSIETNPSICENIRGRTYKAARQHEDGCEK